MDNLWLILIGLLAGASGGLLGVGGSIVMIPALVLLYGPDRQHLYQASAMIVNFFVVIPAVIRHQGAAATFRPVTRCTIPAAIVGAVAGVWVSEWPVFRGPGQGYLQIIFAAFLLYVVAYNLIRLSSGARLPRMTEAQSGRLSKAAIIGLVGIPTGLFGGLLGVGGGLIAVPAQQIALKIPLKNAIANSAATILWSSIVGAVIKNSQLAHHGFTIVDSARLALLLAAPAIAASYFAAKRVHVWPVAVIRTAFVVLLLYGGIRVLMAGWSQVPSGR